MKVLKKILAAVLVLMLLLSVAACHPKDEIALKVGDVEITSALYMYCLLEADSAARSKIDADVQASASSGSTTQTAVDYYKQEIDGKKFTDYVKDTALERCREMAFYEYICKENNITLSEDTLSNVDALVDMYWTSYGYSVIYEPNGVGKETFKRAVTNDYLKDEYFFFIYGEGGEKEVSDEELEKKVKETFLTAEVLQATISSTMKAEEKTNLLNKFKDYEKRLNKGEDFKAVYNHYYGIKEETTSSTTTSSATTSSATSSETTSSTASGSEEEEKTYKYPYASVLAAKDSKLTNYASELYADAAKLKNDEVKYIETKEMVAIIVRRDMEGDELRMDELKKTMLWSEKSEEFEKGVDEKIATLTFEENSFAIDRFKVKNIFYPTY